MLRFCIFIALGLSLTNGFPADGVGHAGAALRQAHAHNDYKHDRPLMDALSHGFTSVEADVHLRNGELLVGHDAEDLESAKTLAALYLDPLKRLAAGKRSVFESGESLTLLIDFKTEAEGTYGALKKVLEEYRPMLTVFEEGRIQTNAVTVILSGNRPRGTLLAEKKRYAAYDGRVSDLGKQDLATSFMPLVSDSWLSHFKWNGEGTIPEAERIKLRALVAQAHEEKRRIRFWATPDKSAAWTELRDAGVDLINTDDLPGLAAFLRR